MPTLAAEGPPETTSVRLPKHPGICVAPEYVIDDLLRAEGFTDIRRVPLPPPGSTPDLIGAWRPRFRLDDPHYRHRSRVAMKVMVGVHVGCFELFVREGIRGFADLVGKKIGIEGMGSPEHLFLWVITANVGIDPKAQIKWVTATIAETPRRSALRQSNEPLRHRDSSRNLLF